MPSLSHPRSVSQVSLRMPMHKRGRRSGRVDPHLSESTIAATGKQCWHPREKRNHDLRLPKALWARNPQKVSKGLLGPPGPECQKGAENVPKDPKKSKKGVKISVRALFWHSGRGGLGRPFWDFLGISGLGGVETPVPGGIANLQS